MNLSDFGDRKKPPLWNGEWSWFGGLLDKPVGTMTLRELRRVLLGVLWLWCLVLGAIACCCWVVAAVVEKAVRE